jgi:hypothetical protein
MTPQLQLSDQSLSQSLDLTFQRQTTLLIPN